MPSASGPESALAFRDETGGKIYSTGCFCGIAGSVYGDLDAWLNILSKGGRCVFIAECLSAFRLHGEQNTYNPYVRAKLPLDMLNFLTVAWLNNIFLRDAGEYNYCLEKWLVMAGMWATPETADDSAEILRLKKLIAALMELDAAGEFRRGDFKPAGALTGGKSDNRAGAEKFARAVGKGGRRDFDALQTGVRACKL